MTDDSKKIHRYFSLQYSAIQQTVLRHDRLWSMAGISQVLLELNEIILPSIAKTHGGETVVAGGGKFTAFFKDDKRAENARQEIIKAVATTLPMLEFQTSEIVNADSLVKAVKEKDLLSALAEQKRRFRGYGVTYNPHLMVCQECGEYPAVEKMQGKSVCRICGKARTSKPSTGKTSIERVYYKYFDGLNKMKHEDWPKIPANFENLFPQPKADESDQAKRMSVWLSDTNNMNKKVPIWFNQDDKKIKETFEKLNEVTIGIIADALKKTFPKKTWNKWKENNQDVTYIPFRLIVAGGDDLCLVMDEQYVLDFALALSSSVNAKIDSIQNDNQYQFLQKKWLEDRAQEYAEKEGKDYQDPGPFCFGSAFLITPVHTPFKKIHEAGEDLMKAAKEKTQRQANSIYWQVLAVDAPDSAPVDFEKPIVIDKSSKTNTPGVADCLSFEEYVDLRNFYRSYLTGSKQSKLGAILVRAEGDAGRVEKALMHDAARGDKAAGFLLCDQHFRTEGELNIARLATLLELLNIKRAGEEKS